MLSIFLYNKLVISIIRQLLNIALKCGTGTKKRQIMYLDGLRGRVFHKLKQNPDKSQTTQTERKKQKKWFSKEEEIVWAGSGPNNFTDQQTKAALSARKQMKINCTACYENIWCKHFLLGKPTRLSIGTSCLHDYKKTFSEYNLMSLC